MSAWAALSPLATRRTSLKVRGSLRWGLACAAVLAVALLLRLVTDPNEDVSWLLDVADRVVGGARLYVDFLEVNPPASVFIYIPAVLLSRATGFGWDRASDLAVALACSVSLLTTAIILKSGHALPRRPGLMAVGALVVLLIVPSYTFAEREHIAVLALLPALAALTVRCRPAQPAAWLVLLAGIGAGLATSIKPIFALGLVGPALCVLRASGWRALVRSGELWIGATLAAAYGAAVLVLLPAFAERVLPIAWAVYVPVRSPSWFLLSSAGVLTWLGTALAVAWSATRQRPSALTAVLISASAGFVAVYLQQGKGFAYQCYPAIALGLLAVLADVASVDGSTPPRNGALGARAFLRIEAASLVALGLSGANFLDRHYDPEFWTPGLKAGVLAVSPHPKVLAISQNLALGQPFARAIGGAWVGSAPSTWITGNAEALIEQGADPALFRRWMQREESLYAQDIETRRPDVVLVAGDRWQAWIDRSPLLRDAMAPYRKIGQYNAVALWARTPDPQAEPESLEP